jgi:hypothetical protein
MTKHRAVVDVLREYKPRFTPATVIAELAALCKKYNIYEVEGDKFAGGFHADEWQRHFKPCERTTSENYLTLLPMLLNGRARLLDNATLRAQLAGLERKATATGHEVVTHAQVSGAHDDLSTAAAGALAAVGSGYTYDTLYRAWDENYVEPDSLAAKQAAPETPPPLTADGNWWRHKQHLRSSMGSADDQLRSLYGAVDNFFRYR